MTKWLEPREQRLIARPDGVRIQKQRLGGENSLAIEIVLHLLARRVADSHRSHTSVTGQTFRDLLWRNPTAVDGVHRNEMDVVCRFRDSQKKAEKAFDRAELTQSAEGVCRKVGVARPAVAVIPVPPR